MENKIIEISGEKGFFILNNAKVYKKIIELENNSFLVDKNGEFEVIE